jgi:hypothetical protein
MRRRLITRLRLAVHGLKTLPSEPEPKRRGIGIMASTSDW